MGPVPPSDEIWMKFSRSQTSSRHLVQTGLSKTMKEADRMMIFKGANNAFAEKGGS